MRTYPECYPCFLKQALNTARLAGSGEQEQWHVMREVMRNLKSHDSSVPPPVMGRKIQQIVKKVMRVDDLYGHVKLQSTKEVLDLYPGLKQKVAQAEDPLEMAVRLSIAGNIIDYGTLEPFDIHETIDRVLNAAFAIGDLEAFRKQLADSERILFLGDNAGETVLDRLLIETMGKPVDYAVKSGPVLNDAIRSEAEQAGLHHVARVIENGSDLPGTLLDECSASFREHFYRADMVIAKGQGNFETLSGVDRPVFFLLQTKCPVISDHLGVPEKSVVCLHHQPEME